MSYDDVDDTTSWIIDRESTHNMNGFTNQIFSLTLKGYDDGVIVKGLVSST